MDITEVYSKLTAIKYLRELPNTVESNEDGNRFLTLSQSKNIVDKIADITASSLQTPAVVPTFDYNTANEKMYIALDAINHIVMMQCHNLSIGQAANLQIELVKASKAVSNILKVLSDNRGF